MSSQQYEDTVVRGDPYATWGEGEGAALPEDGPIYFIRMMRKNPIIFIWFFVAVVSASISAVYILRFYLERRFGITCCADSAAARSAERRRNAAIAAQQQKELDDEARRKALERTKRILREVTLLVEAHHLEKDQQDFDALETGVCEEGGSAAVLNIPGLRRTEGHCAICIAEYLPGDKVVWSPNDECRHVFHDECILSWLSKDRKDCPCCRMPFIPEEKEEDDDKREVNASGSTTSETQASLDTDESESSFGDEEEAVPSAISDSNSS